MWIMPLPFTHPCFHDASSPSPSPSCFLPKEHTYASRRNRFGNFASTTTAAMRKKRKKKKKKRLSCLVEEQPSFNHGNGVDLGLIHSQEEERLSTEKTTTAAATTTNIMVSISQEKEEEEEEEEEEEAVDDDGDDERFSKYALFDRLRRGCKHLEEGMVFHSLVIKLGFELKTWEKNLLVQMYGGFGALKEAYSLFESMICHDDDTTSWNTMVSVFVHSKSSMMEVFPLFLKMKERGIEPDRVSLKLILRAAADLRELEEGQSIHFYINIKGLELDPGICLSLLYMYGKCGAFQEARFVFDNMPERDEFAWVTMATSYSKEGYCEEIIELYRKMLQEGLIPGKTILNAVVDACGNLADLKQGEIVHKYIKQSSLYASDLDLANSLIIMYGRCKSLHLALSIFENISIRTVKSYNVMIGAYLGQELYGKVFELFGKMLKEGIKPDAFTYSSVLQASALTACLYIDGKIIHSYIIKDGLDTSSMLETAIINMYCKCGDITEAYFLFDRMKEKDNVITWNALISACAQHGDSLRSIQLFKRMQREGICSVNEATFCGVLNACANLNALEEGRIVHYFLVCLSLELDDLTSSSLINMYGKCGSLEDARHVFDNIQNANVIHWTCMIVVYVQQGRAMQALELFSKMHDRNLKPNNVTLVNILSACSSLGDLVKGRLVHTHVIESELETDYGLLNALLNMYSRCGAISDARWVFERIHPKGLLSYNILIAAYAREECSDLAINVLEEMQHVNIVPDIGTYVSVLSACGYPELLEKGRDIHSSVVQKGFDSVLSITTALITMYGKCGVVEEAHHVFEGIVGKNVISWTAIITAYAQQGYGEEAIQLFTEMKLEGISPDTITLVSILGAYANLEAVADEEIIQECYKHKFESNIKLGNALITMYGRCGRVGDARSIFNQMYERDVSSWNAMIFIYGHCTFCREALQLLQEMHEEKVSPNELTWIYCLSNCGTLGALGQGKKIHSCVIECGHECNTGVGNALINMYSKCGAATEAFAVFNSIMQDVVSWNAMLSCFCQLGDGKKSIELFEQMQCDDTRPDEVTFLTVLSACSHGGLIEEGIKFFKSMIEDHLILPTVGHYGCLVDLFGKSGHLDVAEDLIYSMPVRASALIWMTLLGACRNLSDIERGEVALNYITLLEPGDGAPYILLSNIYAMNGRWDDVRKLRDMMDRKGLKKRPGCSMIEVNNEVHSFFPRDRRHPDSTAIYAKLNSLNLQLKEQGYVPDTRLVLHDVDEEEKKSILCCHSERLALSFGLINTPSKTPLLIVKNLRMCADCHRVFKLLSIILERKISLKDGSRLHCFHDGLCSCGDYW